MKKIMLLTSFISFFNYNTCQTSPINTLSKQQILFGIIGTTATLFLGKLLYEAYYDYCWPTINMITYCQSSFKTIQSITQKLNNEYEIITQHSDWVLKEYISTHYEKPYPFMSYHSQLTQDLYTLSSQEYDLTKAIKRIEYRIHCPKTISSEQNTILLDKLIELKSHAYQLKKLLKRIIMLIKTLKNRVELFREYNEDLFHWTEQQKQEESKKIS